MKKALAIGAALLLLAACKPSEEEQRNLRNALPEGCVVHDIGSYGEIQRLIVIECTGRMVTTTYTTDLRSNGKVSSRYTSAVFLIE